MTFHRLSSFLLLLACAAPTVAHSQACTPLSERWLGESLLQSLPQDVRLERQAAVDQTLAACPGAFEVFLSSLMSREFLAQRRADPALAAGPTPPSVARTVNTRSFGYAHGRVSFNVAGESYTLRDHVYTSPLLLDLDGDTVPDVAGNQWQPHPGGVPGGPRAAFDMDGDTFEDVTEWVRPDDGLLVAPHDPLSITFGAGGLSWSGPVSILDLLGTGEGFRDGFAKLAHRFDLDDDGVVTGGELDGLYVWRDLDGDARIDDGELDTCTGLGIAALILPAGSCTGSFIRNGSVAAMWDWWPSYVTVDRLRAGAAVPSSVALTDDPLPDRSFLAGPIASGADVTLPAAGLAAAGMDLSTARLIGVSPGGTRFLLMDTTSDPSDIDAGCVRRLWIFTDPGGGGGAGGMTPLVVPIPGSDVLQFAFEDEAHAWMLTDGGTRAIRIDLETGSLRRVMNRAPGLPGLRGAHFMHSQGGRLFFGGAFHDAQHASGGEVMVERIAGADAGSLVAVANLDSLRAAVSALGTIEGELPVSPDALYFVVLPSGGGSQLVRVSGGAPVALDSGVAPTGIAEGGGRVLYFREIAGSSSVEVRLYDGGTSTATTLATGDFSYPYLSRNGDRALFASFDWGAGTQTLWTMPTTTAGDPLRVCTTGIGAVRLAADGEVVAVLAAEGVVVTRPGLVGVDGRAAAWSHRAAPSPGGAATAIHFTLPAPCDVRVEIFGADGRRVAAPHSGPLAAGTHRVPWDGRTASGRVGPGVYFYRVTAGSLSGTGKVVRME